MSNRIKKSQEILKKGYFQNLPFISEEINLWRAVLDLALSDLLKGKENFKEDLNPAHSSEFFSSVPSSITLSCFMNPVTWDGLINWFSTSCEDFKLVCEFADIDYNIVYNKMKEALTSV